jgi:hypothetical protein
MIEFGFMEIESIFLSGLTHEIAMGLLGDC